MGQFAKKASDHIPYAADQGMPYLAAAGKAGVAVQGATYAMESGGVVTFAGLGLSNMKSGSYQVIVQNHTDVADPGVVSAKTGLGFTITGPDVADVLDLVIVGALADQMTA